jgi:hypothetical protein
VTDVVSNGNRFGNLSTLFVEPHRAPYDILNPVACFYIFHHAKEDIATTKILLFVLEGFFIIIEQEEIHK